MLGGWWLDVVEDRARFNIARAFTSQSWGMALVQLPYLVVFLETQTL